MQPHDRDQVRRLGGGGLSQRLVDHLQAAIALLAEPEVIGIAQVDLKIGFLVGAQSFLEDPLELDLDGVGQAKDGTVAAAGLLRLALHQHALGLLQNLAEPGHSPRGEFGVGNELLDVAEQAIDLAFQRAFILLHLDLSRFDPYPGHPVNRAGIGGQIDRSRLCRRHRPEPCRHRLRSPAGAGSSTGVSPGHSSLRAP